MQNGYIVDARGVQKTYDTGKVKVHALRGIDLNVKEGEMVAIMGPSGCGKTTLLNCFSGLDRIDEGEIYVKGNLITKMSDEQRTRFRAEDMGFIFQAFNLLPVLSVVENVELPMLASKIDGRTRKKRSEELLSTVGLADRMDHKPDELSGGERQRVAIAAAIANDPKVLLCDEPTGDLDTETGGLIVEYLHKVNKEYGKTVLMVTHDPSIARQCDRIYRIRDGQIISVQTPTMDDQMGATSRVDVIRDRLAEIKAEIARLDEQAKAGSLDLGVFAGRRTQLADRQKMFEEELHRLGL